MFQTNTRSKFEHPLLTISIVNLNHFRLLRVVGKGAFGKVRIVERKDTGLTFALKYIRKDEGGFVHTPCSDGSICQHRATWASRDSMLMLCHSRTVGKRSQHYS